MNAYHATDRQRGTRTTSVSDGPATHSDRHDGKGRLSACDLNKPIGPSVTLGVLALRRLSVKRDAMTATVRERGEGRDHPVGSSPRNPSTAAPLYLQVNSPIFCGSKSGKTGRASGRPIGPVKTSARTER